MAKKKVTPLQAAFLFTEQEKRYILIVCTIFAVGVIARYFHLKKEKNREYIPPPVQVEKNDR